MRHRPERQHAAGRLTGKVFAASVLVLFSLIRTTPSDMISGAGNETSREIVSLEARDGIAATLRHLNFDLLFEWEGRVYALVGSDELLTLNRLGLAYLVETPRFPASPSLDFAAAGGVNGDYHTYKELEADLQALERAFPGLAKVYTLGTSLEGRKILAIKISDSVTLDEDEAEVLFLGCHHAREWISVEVPFLLAKHLLENAASDPEIRRRIEESEIWIVPLVNPDGLEYSIHAYRYWRKNRRLNADGTFGVDLNRNYGFAWGIDNAGSSPNPASDIYRGTAPFSEPETRAVRDLFLQKSFHALVSYHSYSQLILHPWGYTTAPADKEPLLRDLGEAMASLMAPVNGRVYRTGPAGAFLYLTNGDTTDWAFGVSGIPAYTIELPPVDQLGGGFFNAERDILPIFRENLPAALYLVDWSIGTHASPGSQAGKERRLGSRPGVEKIH